jgi:tripartite-type tricarboxylate transporter receptor subunit TctC
MSDIPTVSEVVRKDFEEDVWNGAVVPAKTPGETVTQLADWLHAAILSAEVRPKLGVQGFSAAGACGADFASFLREQVSEYGQLIRETNMKAE